MRWCDILRTQSRGRAVLTVESSVPMLPADYLIPVRSLQPAIFCCCKRTDIRKQHDICTDKADTRMLRRTVLLVTCPNRRNRRFYAIPGMCKWCTIPILIPPRGAPMGHPWGTHGPHTKGAKMKPSHKKLNNVDRR